MNDDGISPLAVQTAVQGAELADAKLSMQLQPATVVSYSEGPTAQVSVSPDGSLTVVPVESLLNQPLVPGTRVMLAWTPPAGCFVVGIIGNSPQPYIVLTSSVTQAIANNTETTVLWPTVLASTPSMSVLNGVVSLPYTGLYAACASVIWTPYSFAASLTRSRWVHIQRCDSAEVLIEELALTKYATDVATTTEQPIAMNPAQDTWFCNASDKLRVSVWHNGGFSHNLDGSAAGRGKPSFTVRYIGPAIPS